MSHRISTVHDDEISYSEAGAAYLVDKRRRAMAPKKTQPPPPAEPTAGPSSAPSSQQPQPPRLQSMVFPPFTVPGLSTLPPSHRKPVGGYPYQGQPQYVSPTTANPPPVLPAPSRSAPTTSSPPPTANDDIHDPTSVNYQSMHRRNRPASDGDNSPTLIRTSTGDSLKKVASKTKKVVGKASDSVIKSSVNVVKSLQNTVAEARRKRLERENQKHLEEQEKIKEWEPAFIAHTGHKKHVAANPISREYSSNLFHEAQLEARREQSKAEKRWRGVYPMMERRGFYENLGHSPASVDRLVKIEQDDERAAKDKEDEELAEYRAKNLAWKYGRDPRHREPSEESDMFAGEIDPDARKKRWQVDMYEAHKVAEAEKRLKKPTPMDKVKRAATAAVNATLDAVASIEIDDKSSVIGFSDAAPLGAMEPCRNCKREGQPLKLGLCPHCKYI